MVRSPVRVPHNPDVPTLHTSTEPLRKREISLAGLNHEIYGPFRKSVSTREESNTITIPKYSSWLRKSQPKPFTTGRPLKKSTSLAFQASQNPKNVAETSHDFQLYLTNLNESQPQDPFNDPKISNLDIKTPNKNTLGTFPK